MCLSLRKQRARLLGLSQPNLNSLDESTNASESMTEASETGSAMATVDDLESEAGLASLTSTSVAVGCGSRNNTNYSLQGCRMKGHLNLLKRATSNPNLSEAQQHLLGRIGTTSNVEECKGKRRNPLIAQWEQKIQSNEQIVKQG